MTSDAIPVSEAAVLRKAAWRLLPFLMFAYFLAFLDRVNAGFAALQMNQDVGLSHAAFGLGGGLFFLGYFVFEVPSNLLLARLGAHLWIGRILVTWGLAAAAMALVQGPLSFYALRFLLGVAEAGFFPGVILYLTYWFPRAHRARIISAFMVAVPLSNFIGSPLSAALLGLEGRMGLHGWQWMFLLEGAPAVLTGLVAFIYLPARPDRARWLTEPERRWIAGRLTEEAQQPAPVRDTSLWRVLTDKYVLAAALVYAGGSGASSCLALWAPQFIKSFGLSAMSVGWLNALPFALAAPAMLLWGRRSDVTRERTWHTALPLALTGLALAAAPLTTSLPVTMTLLCLAVIGTYAVKGPFWALSTEWLSSPAAAAGIAQINAIGNLGGLIATTAMGAIKEAGGSYAQGLLPLAAITGVSALVVLLMGRRDLAPAAQPG